MMMGKLALLAVFVAFVLAALLWALAALHFYWATGGCYPARDEAALARMVVGSPKICKMPSPIACMSVAFLLALFGFWPLLLVGVLPPVLPRGFVVAWGIAVGLIFLGRGFVAYRPEFRRYFPEEPFATLDRRFYAPLCLAVGAGVFLLLIAG